MKKGNKDIIAEQGREGTVSDNTPHTTKMEQYKRDSTIPVYINKKEPLQNPTQPRKDTYPAAD